MPQLWRCIGIEFDAGKTAPLRACGLAEDMGEPLHGCRSRFAFCQVRGSGRESRNPARGPQSFTADDAAALNPDRVLALRVCFRSKQRFAKPVLEV
jgi:hypothetical protein